MHKLAWALCAALAASACGGAAAPSTGGTAPAVRVANFAVATVAVIPYVVPLSVVLLGASFAWSVRRLARSAGVVPSVPPAAA